MAGKRSVVVVVVLALVALVVAASGYREEERWSRGGDEGGTGRREGEDWFLLQDSEHVVRTDGGSMKVVRGAGSRFMMSPMHIGFITMEPNTIFIPQYLDATLILFVRRGEARVGNIYKDELVERRLKTGDIYRIGAGSAFYLVNTAEGQRLHIICSIDATESLGHKTFQSFYIAGGKYPASVLSGFDRLTLSTAFNVTEEDVELMLESQDSGPIMYLSNTTETERQYSPSFWSKFLDMDHNQKAAQMRRIVRIRADESEEEAELQSTTWSFRKMMLSFFDWSDRKKDDRKGSRTGKGPDPYNLYDRKPDFKNDYGWSVALDERDYSPLRHNDIGVYLVNLTAGSMMAPHINPMATEYGVVLSGAGTIQVVYPNGSLAMNAKVGEGDVFWIPRYLPFCQIASRTGPFEFFGFTTSSRYNWPQFLVGANSLLHTMRGPEFAAAFGLSGQRLDEIIDAQRESTILPSATVAPPDEAAPVKAERGSLL